MSEILDTPSSAYYDGAIARERRRRSFKAGIISYNNHSITIDCVIRDQTSTGFKVKIGEGRMVPNEFRLSVPVDGIKADCVVRWRNADMLGLEIVGQAVRDNINARTQSLDSKFVSPGNQGIRKS